MLDFAGGARVISIPGHTDGSIAVYLSKSRILFTGDTIANVGELMLGTFNVDRARTIESFHCLAELDTEVACFGHGEPISSKAGAELRAVAQKLTTSPTTVRPSPKRHLPTVAGHGHHDARQRRPNQ
ncbi:MBL fold metallo-hydrolase [Saccharopolyspora hattusasensis]|uniref:MBL fold metallo-hydrolase n=1 Tax=Saccharopolyspora hattusasensis TaxID=1128679 RepID=UPI003D95E273